MPSPIVWPLSRYMRYALHAGAWAATYLYNQLEQATDAPVIEWRRLQIVWDRLGAENGEDAMICTFDFLNQNYDDADGGWGTGAYEAAETDLTAWLTSISTFQANIVRAIEYRWYRGTFKDPAQGGGISNAGPPVRVTSISITGAQSAAVPAQVAASVTERTALARHWGRFYVPGIAVAALDGSGRLSSAFVTSLASATDELYEELHAAGTNPVVPVTRMDGQPVQALLGVTAIQVDNVPDVIRSRRVRENIIRVTFPVDP